jgi:hypothetical protein
LVGANKVFGELDSAQVSSPPAGAGVLLPDDPPALDAVLAPLVEPAVELAAELPPDPVAELVAGADDEVLPPEDPELLLHAASTMAAATAAAAAAVPIRRRTRREARPGSDSWVDTCYLLDVRSAATAPGILPVRQGRMRDDDMG